MNWLALIVVLLAALLALKLAGFLIRLLLVLLALAALYWLVAPHLGLPLPA